MEVKPHSSEESEDKMADGDRENADNDEYLNYLLMERATARSRGCNGGWGWLVGR